MRNGRFILCLTFIMVFGVYMASAQEKTTNTTPKVQVPDTEEVAVLHTTDGDIVLQLFPDVAPGHVKNFKKLINEKFYDGIKFHRVIKGFMIQAGCPYSKTDQVERWGTGGPGYTIKAEFNKKPHIRGTLSMARTSDPDSAGSQFFICHGSPRQLDGKYTVFGFTIAGMDVVDKIATAPVKADPNGYKSLPVNPVVIKKAEIIKWGDYKKNQKLEVKEK